ncbi:hypothetical protein PF008_g15946 [Phytophthora fragariae]|uniref:Uncharacterized protein n=2 Tax=Phytophthora fragariae TaxID=53985 RepID=A0A6G0RCM1_9STRA|nr:hypothetical protein PF008_g15946 [Phytophthora fragariae]
MVQEHLDISTRWARSVRRVDVQRTETKPNVITVEPSQPPSRNGLVLRLCQPISRFLVMVGGWIYRLLDRLPGQCTVSKLDAFETFCRETPPKTVAAILLLTPLPCLAFNLLIECIPLSDPGTGLAGSGFYQLRMFLTRLISALMPSLIKLDCVPESPVNSPLTLLLFAVSQAAIFLATNALISLAADVFPVPLSLFTAIVPMAIAGRLMFYRRLPKDPQFHAQSNKVNLWVTIEMLPLFVYPAFTVGFISLTSTQQFWVSLLIPLLKTVIRRVLWWITKDDYDLINVMTGCVGQLYHVLFIALALQNSKSLSTMGVIVALGISRMLLNCRYILNDCKKIQNAKAKLEDIEPLMEEDDFHLALKLAREPRVANVLHKKLPSLLLSTYPGYRESDFMARYEETLRAQHAAAVHSLGVVSRPSLLSSARPKNAPNTWTIAALEISPSVRRADYVSSVASAMHQSEIILLRSYLVIWMTSFYVIYLVAVFWLPNRRYFATQATMTTFEAVGISVTRLLLVCGMEIALLGIQLVLITVAVFVAATRWEVRRRRWWISTAPSATQIASGKLRRISGRLAKPFRINGKKKNGSCSRKGHRAAKTCMATTGRLEC